MLDYYIGEIVNSIYSKKVLEIIGAKYTASHIAGAKIYIYVDKEVRPCKKDNSVSMIELYIDNQFAPEWDLSHSARVDNKSL